MRTHTQTPATHQFGASIFSLFRKPKPLQFSHRSSYINHTHQITMKIQTSFVHPPIPIRDFDWSAIDDDTYDYDAPIGQGPTEVAAIADLLRQLAEE